MTTSLLRTLMADRIGEDPVDIIRRERPGTSYRRIAADLTARTGVPVSHETLRRWESEDARAVA